MDTDTAIRVDNVDKVITSTAKDVGKEVEAAKPKVSKQNWSEFVSSISC